jgi:hypothetical protein
MKGKINLIPSIADVIFVTLFICLSFAGSGLLLDGDTGFHIRAGEFIIDTFSVPRHDMFRFLSPPLPWTDHEWLSDVIMAFSHRAFGLTGVVIFFCFLIASVYCLLFKVIRTHNGNMISAVIVILLVIASSQMHFLARPHIFSLLLLVVWYYLLDTYQYEDRNHLYFLPPIMLLWVNLHGAFIIGPLLIGVYLFGNIVFSLTSGGAEKQQYKQKARNLALTMFACLILSLINPYSYHILLFPFEISSNKLIMDNVQEFLSPNFHDPLPFKYLLFLLIAIFAISRASLNITEIILVLLFANMALYSKRHIPLFAIIVAPVLIRQIDLILDKGNGRFTRFIKKRSENIASIDACSRGYLWPLGVSLVVVIFFAAGMIEYKFDEKRKPVEAVEFLKRENIPGNMFNKDEFGDYIIYAAWPNYKVFIDGRVEIHGPEGLMDFLKVARIKPGMDEVFKKYDINWIIFSSGSSLSHFLLQSDDWKLIYSDVVANIFIRNTTENQGLIEKYKNTRPVYAGSVRREGKDEDCKRNL